MRGESITLFFVLFIKLFMNILAQDYSRLKSVRTDLHHYGKNRDEITCQVFIIMPVL